MVNNELGNQHLQFTAEICTNEKTPPTSENKERVNISAAKTFPLLHINMRCSTEGGLQFGFLL